LKAPDNLTKLYYSISEVAKMFDVSNSLLRYWESEFSALKIKKNRKGDRQYQVKDIETLATIYTLVKERGFTIDGAKKELKKKPSKSSQESSKKDIKEIQKRLIQLKTEMKKFLQSM
jgi:DNA-binding transcriptional MerR regulator